MAVNPQGRTDFRRVTVLIQAHQCNLQGVLHCLSLPGRVLLLTHARGPNLISQSEREKISVYAKYNH